MTISNGRRGRSALTPLLLSLTIVAVAGCSSRPLARAPVEDRGGAARPVVVPTTTPAASSGSSTLPPLAASSASAPASGSNDGKPGYFTVRPGDTLMRIGLETGQNWRDIQQWNGLENSNVLEVGQVLRVVPPNVDASQVASRPINAARVESRPLDGRGPAPVTTVTPPAASASTPVITVPAVPASGTAATPLGGAPAMVATPPVEAAPGASAAATGVADAGDEIQWLWPAAGAVSRGFDEGRSKGLVIMGKAGDPVMAAADGRVVYAGSGLRGYGNLVIVKHNATYLTAYAHNQALLVKEDQPVKRGQKIAEMGSTDAERVQLHFEIRRLGKPIDPARLLPPR